MKPSGKEIRLVCLIGAPEGFERVRGAHPDVPIWTASIDDGPDLRAGTSVAHHPETTGVVTGHAGDADRELQFHHSRYF